MTPALEISRGELTDYMSLSGFTDIRDVPAGTVAPSPRSEHRAKARRS